MNRNSEDFHKDVVSPVIVTNMHNRAHENIFQFPERNFQLFTQSEKDQLLKIYIKEENLIGC